jgi:hypothetical protein
VDSPQNASVLNPLADGGKRSLTFDGPFCLKVESFEGILPLEGAA